MDTFQISGYRTRSRPVLREGLHEGNICPHQEEIQPCKYPACYSWKVIPSNKCTLKYPDMQCGEGMMNRTSVCVGLNGVSTNIGNTIIIPNSTGKYIDHKNPMGLIFSSAKLKVAICCTFCML